MENPRATAAAEVQNINSQTKTIQRAIVFIHVYLICSHVILRLFKTGPN